MSKRRRILMLTTQLGYGGAETSFIRLANFLSQSMDVTVALFTADYGSAAQYASGHEPLRAAIQLLDAPTRQPHVVRWLRRIWRVRALKMTHDATISFLSGPNLVNVLAGENRVSIVSLRGSRMFDPTLAHWQRRLFYYLLDPIIFALAARIVPVSAGLSYEIRQVSPERMLKKVRVISPFIESAGQPVIVAAGRMAVEKGFHHLIRVVAALALIQPGVKLLLVGDGPMLAQLRVLCADYGLAMDDTNEGVSSVIFTGYRPNVLPLMALGRLYAMTSATEGFPSVLLEAMAAGVPVVAANTPWGVRSILCAKEPDITKPYPTKTAEATDYGTLMPRIDAPENEALWVKCLHEALANPRAPNAETLQRPHAYDLSVVGQKWESLLSEMDRS
jgi:glycosyltransferase involved in cell wall biosynthesis